MPMWGAVMPPRARTNQQQRLQRLTQDELAQLLDVSPRTLVNWRNEGCPHERQGTRISYVPARVVRWMLDRERARIEADAAPADVATTEAAEKLRKMRADADRAEMLAAKMRGELAPVADMDAAVERLAVAVRTEMNGLRARWALSIVGIQTPAEAAAMLDRMAQQVLGALAHAAADMGDDGATLEDDTDAEEDAA